MRCWECGREFPDDDFKRHFKTHTYWVKSCKDCIRTKKAKTRKKRYTSSWYASVLYKQGYELKKTIWGNETKLITMEFTLVSLADKVSDPINYGALGFNVSDDGTLAETSISVDTETDPAYKGLCRKDIINKIKKLTGCPLTIGGSVWTINNE